LRGKRDTATLYVGNIDYSASEQDLSNALDKIFKRIHVEKNFRPAVRQVGFDWSWARVVRQEMVVSGGAGGLPKGVEPYLRPQRRAAGWYLAEISGRDGVATRGLPRGAGEVPAGEALAARHPQRVRLCVPAPAAKPRGAEVPPGLAELLSLEWVPGWAGDVGSIRERAYAIWWHGGQEGAKARRAGPWGTRARVGEQGRRRGVQRWQKRRALRPGLSRAVCSDPGRVSGPG
jgi:hypothetical protein